MEEKDLQTQTDALVKNTAELIVLSAQDNEYANGLLKKLTLGEKAIHDYWDKDIKTADILHKGLVKKRKAMLQPVLFGKSEVKGLIENYLQKEREEREKIERELREEAEKKEKIRLAKIAESEEELKRAADHLSPEQIAEEQRKIEEANKKGFTPEVKIDKPEKVAGQVVKTLWKAEVTDKALVPEEYKIVDESALGKIATALKDKANVPGVRFYSQISVSTR